MSSSVIHFEQLDLYLKDLYDLCIKEKWSVMGKADVELSYSTYPRGFFIGKVGGEVISYLSAVLYGDGEFCFIGFYIVESEYRGKGYGIQTWDHAWSTIPDNCKCIALDSLPETVCKYEKYGFKSAWTDIEWTCRADKVVSLPVPPECSDLVFTSYREHDFDELLKYDTSVFGYRRESFLRKLRSFPQWEGWVVSTPNKEIVGYCVIKLTDNHIHGLAPWYANDANIARALLNKAAIFLVNRPQQLDSPAPIISITLPSVNSDGLKLVNMLCDTKIEHIRMFARSVPRVIRENSESRIFGVSSLGSG